jgi:hypothetical protein
MVPASGLHAPVGQGPSHSPSHSTLFVCHPIRPVSVVDSVRTSKWHEYIQFAPSHIVFTLSFLCLSLQFELLVAHSLYKIVQNSSVKATSSKDLQWSSVCHVIQIQAASVLQAFAGSYQSPPDSSDCLPVLGLVRLSLKVCLA